MRFLDEYRDPAAARALVAVIGRTVTRPWTLMEVCGGQTHSIVRHGLDQVLPAGVELIHGPGCPVCVTPLSKLDRAQAIASRPGVILCTFGDMLRVPGSRGDLLAIKAAGGDLRVVYSPLEALRLAERHPDRQVVFFAIGFETTAPANATAAELARRKGLSNFSMLVSHVRVPPAVTAILQAPDNRVQAVLGPGHVCAVAGMHEYAPIARRYRVPVVITGFEPLDLLTGILRALQQLESGRCEVENAYGRAVCPDGNPAAMAQVERIFQVCDQEWRGMGTLPKSGLRLAAEYRDLDAEHRFDVGGIQTREPEVCIAGQVLRGARKPTDCQAFGIRCTPLTPLGAPMVSSEGACAAYHAYRKGAAGCR